MSPSLRVMFLLLTCASAAVTSPAHAQAVHGTLRDEEQDRPIAAARLYLISADAIVVDSTRTDRNGRYRVEAPAAGTYRLQFESDGWAGIASDEIVLVAGQETPFEFRVSLVPHAALRQMSEMIGMDERLQTSLPEVCGEALRPWEAGVLVGIVRAKRTKAALPGTRVWATTEAGDVARSTIASERGIYLLCNVPLGDAVVIVAETTDGRIERTPVEIRAGMVSWYDLLIP